MSRDPNRRELLVSVAALLAAGGLPRSGRAQDAPGWRAGPVRHLIPAASHDRILLKASFTEPLGFQPRLQAGPARASGVATDSTGAYWSFDVAGLSADSDYELSLTDPSGTRLCDPWPLRTFPHPAAEPESFRLLAFTCAGGLEGKLGGGPEVFLPLDIRQRLLRRAMSYRPQAMIAIGDHVYWDLRTHIEEVDPAVRRAIEAAAGGPLDRSLGARGTANEPVLEAVGRRQIADLYGVLLRSTPSYFVNDDHDYFENDEATAAHVTLPPERYQTEFSRFVRNLFVPDFLPDPTRPSLMSGSGAGDRWPGAGESFGTLRYGKLAEALIYDCGRYLSLKGELAGLVPPEAEAWLLARTRDEEVRQLLHVPSHPFRWSAGKWREWYPDVADAEGGEQGRTLQLDRDDPSRFTLTKERPKFFWQPGWFQQHQRLLEAMAGQRRRAPIVLSGDLHAVGHAVVERSGDLDLRRNPVHSVLTGPVGTLRGWPSAARGTPPRPAIDIGMDERAGVLEKNGFTLLDVSADEVRVRLFAWRSPDPVEAIDGLEPYHDTVVRRR